MSAVRKYANLPDLDQAPEVYQTTEDAETATTARGDSEPSPSPSVSDSDDDESAIQRSRLDPDSARRQFRSARVDASKADFSDQIGHHKRSYYVSNTQADDDLEELDPEQRLKRHNISRRIERLQQSLEDLQNDVEASKEKGDWQETTQEDEDEQDDAALISMSESMRQLTATDRGTDSATTSMKKRAAMKQHRAPIRLKVDDDSSLAPLAPEQLQNYSHISDSQALAVYTKFSSRLSTLESLVGLYSIPPPDLPSTKDYTMPLMKMTDIMARQLNLLNDTEESFLDQLASRIRTITSDAERMEEKRKQAKKEFDNLVATRDATTAGSGTANGYPVMPRSPTLSGTTRMAGRDEEVDSRAFQAEHPLLDPELPAKISALHSTLPAIENLAPVLHPILERLRALKEVHQDSASASTRLTEVEQHEVEIQKQLRVWRDMLDELEQHTNELEEEWLENMKNVEDKVKALEKRIAAL